MIEKDGLKAWLKYRIRKKSILEIVETEVPEEWRGKGVGRLLVNTAVNFAQAQNYTVRAVCLFARKLLERILVTGNNIQ